MKKVSPIIQCSMTKGTKVGKGRPRVKNNFQVYFCRVHTGNLKMEMVVGMREKQTESELELKMFERNLFK